MSVIKRLTSSDGENDSEHNHEIKVLSEQLNQEKRGGNCDHGESVQIGRRNDASIGNQTVKHTAWNVHDTFTLKTSFYFCY